MTSGQDILFWRQALDEYREKNPGDTRSPIEMEPSTLSAILLRAQKLKEESKELL